MARNQSYSDALFRLVKALNETGIKYAVTGAAAVGFYGIPRSSMDIDVVVRGNLTGAEIERLESSLSRNGFAISRSELEMAAAGNETKFQAFDNKTGFLRIDFFMEKTFGRVSDRINGMKVWFRTFEDLVAKKIQYGDLDEVKLLLRMRGRDFVKEKIVRLLNPKQKEKFERILKEAQPG